VWTLSALLLWGPAEAIVVTLIIAGIWTPFIDRRWSNASPKWAQRALTVAAEMLAVGFGAIVLEPTRGRLTSGSQNTLWELLAIVTYLAIDTAVVLGVIRLASGVDLLTLLRPWSTRVMLLTEATLSIGVAAAWHTSPLAAVLLCGTLVAAGAGLHYAQLMEAASTDQRTGLLRADSWSETVGRILTREPVGVLLGDLDHFKLINDRFGHLAGDEVLALVGDTITGQLRPGDLAGRWGGEEFVIALPGVDLEGARASAERIIHAVRELSHEVSPTEQVRCTMSIGVALAPVADSGEEAAALRLAVDLADAAMYAAKAAGRDRSAVAGETAAPVEGLDETTSPSSRDVAQVDELVLDLTDPMPALGETKRGTVSS
jgi:diguanylate cyclase